MIKYLFCKQVLSEQLRKKVVEIKKYEEEEIKLNFQLNSYKSQIESLENRINELHFIYKVFKSIIQIFVNISIHFIYKV